MDQLPFAPGDTGSDLVLFARDGDALAVRLNRPRVINALNPEMVQALLPALQAAADDDTIAEVVLSGAGDRGFCSGGDVIALRTITLAGGDPRPFWDREYELNGLLASYPKPVTAIMHGVVMGGGLGLATHTSRRLVTPDTKAAMPETIIGFFPDVGVSHPLSRAPGETGTHLVMTGATVNGTDAIALGLADTMINDATPGAETPAGELVQPRSWIDECYAGDDPVAIVERLAAHDNPAARRTAEVIASRSPLSVAVALAAIRRARVMTLTDVLEQDRILSHNFASASDLAEGVRAQLVDRDNAPQWRHRSLAEVDPALVQRYFVADAIPPDDPPTG